MHRSALFAFAELFRGIEFLKQWRQVFHDALQSHFGSMEQRMTGGAIPFEGIELTFRSRHLDDHADRIRAALWRVSNVLWQQEDFSLANGHFDGRLAGLLYQSQHNVAFKLIKEFFGWIVVVVAALVGPANDRHHEFAVFPHLRIADWRLEFVAILIDPALQVESLERVNRWHFASLSMKRFVRHSLDLNQQMRMR
jgi:hypothetical protein